MHMYSAAIDTLPDAHDPEFPHRAGIILAGLRKLQGSLSEAAGRSRVTPVGDRRAQWCAAPLRRADGDRRARARRDAGSAAVRRPRTRQAVDQGSGHGVGLRKDLIEAVEAEEPATEDETSRIKDLIAALGG